MTSAILMGAGAAVWLAGELLAVIGRRDHPTTWYVRLAQKRHWWVRLIVVAGLAWLYGHFEMGWP